MISELRADSEQGGVWHLVLYSFGGVGVGSKGEEYIFGYDNIVPTRVPPLDVYYFRFRKKKKSTYEIENRIVIVPGIYTINSETSHFEYFYDVDGNQEPRAPDPKNEKKNSAFAPCRFR